MPGMPKSDKFLYDAADKTPPLKDILAVDLQGKIYHNRCALLNPGGVTFGGQLAANCLAAACAASPNYAPASLHVSFLGAGDPSRPFDYLANQRRQGRRLSQLTVSGSQDGKPAVDAIITLSDNGQLRRNAMPLRSFTAFAAPHLSPDDAYDRPTMLAQSACQITQIDRHVLRSFGFLEIRDVAGVERMRNSPQNARSTYWFKVPAATDYTPEEQYILLTLISDFWFSLPMFSQLQEREAAASIGFVSLDHSVWFHGAPRCDGWLLIEAELLISAQARTLCRATILDERGAPVATVLQDGLMTAQPSAT